MGFEKGGRMPNKVKSSTVIFVILILVSLSFAGAGLYLLQKEKAKTSSLQEELANLRIKNNAAETTLKEYKKTIAQLEQKLTDAQASIDTLTNNLEQETKTKQQALDEVEKLKTDLEQQKGLRANLETKLDKAQKDAEKTQAQLKEIESKKAQLEAKVKHLETQASQAQGVELGTIIVAPEGGVSTQGVSGLPTAQPQGALLEGKVLVVNKDYNFVVINLGSKDGVGVGDIFSLYHNEKQIGDVKVEKIHEAMSAADFISASTKDLVTEGDRVVQKPK